MRPIFHLLGSGELPLDLRPAPALVQLARAATSQPRARRALRALRARQHGLQRPLRAP